MTDDTTSFTPAKKQKGDFILAKDWNDAVSEITRLGVIVQATENRTFENVSVSGVVGVGTENPRAKLEVAGKGGHHVDLVVNGRMRSSDAEGGLWVSEDRFVGGHSTNQIGFWNGSKWRLTVQPEGNVGIGTNTPRALLEVGGSFRALENASGERPISMEAPRTADHRGDGNVGGATGLAYRISENPGSGEPIFQVRSAGGAVRFFVEHDGWTGSKSNSAWFSGDRKNYFKSNVGIGTSNPKAKLHVSEGGIQIDGNQQIVFTNEDTSNNLKVQLWGGYGLGINSGTLFYASAGRHSWRDKDGATERMSLSTDPDGGLSVLGTGNSFFAGKLGVGTPSPASELEVKGTVKATTFVGDGSALTGLSKSKWSSSEDGDGISYNEGSKVSIGAADGTSLQIINKSQDAEGDTLVLGAREATNLRLGYHSDYSWIQSHGDKPLALNPRGENLGVGTTAPLGRLHVHGGYLVVSGQGNNAESAESVLNNLPEDSAIIGSTNGGELAFYWKDAAGKTFRAMLAGTGIDSEVEPGPGSSPE